MDKDFIVIRGARQHNLKDLTLKLPRNTSRCFKLLRPRNKLSL